MFFFVNGLAFVYFSLHDKYVITTP